LFADRFIYYLNQNSRRGAGLDEGQYMQMPMGGMQQRDQHWYQDNQEMLEFLTHYLKGESLMNGVWKQTGESMLNDKGVQFVVLQVAQISGKNVVMSNIPSEERVMKLCLNNADSVLRALVLNKDEFGMKPDKLDSIMNLFNNYNEFSIRRALGQGERVFLTRTEQVSRQITSAINNAGNAVKGIPFLGGD